MINYMMQLVNTITHIIVQLKRKLNTFIESSKEVNDYNPKFRIGDNVRISFIFYTDIRLRKLVDNICYFHEKQL